MIAFNEYIKQVTETPQKTLKHSKHCNYCKKFSTLKKNVQEIIDKSEEIRKDEFKAPQFICYGCCTASTLKIKTVYCKNLRTNNENLLKICMYYHCL